MSNWQKAAIWIAALYAVFWIGGRFSFDYTHKCVRSHTEAQYDNQGDPHNVSVCDFYVGNASRWTLGDPVRAVKSGVLDSWQDAVFIVGLLAFFVGWPLVMMWRDRRKEAQRAAWQRQRDEYYGSNDDDR